MPAPQWHSFGRRDALEPGRVGQTARRKSSLRWLGSLVLCSTWLGCGADERPPRLGQREGGSGGLATPTQLASAGSLLGPGGVVGAAGDPLGGGGATAMSTAGTGANSSGAGGSPALPSSQGGLCQAPVQCLQLCQAIDDPSPCGLGSQAQCACVCEDRFSGACPDQLAALVECVDGSTALSCLGRGLLFEGCEQQAIALESCEVQAQEQACARNLPACSQFCEPLTLAFCGQGPESVPSCLCGCEASFEVRCREAFDDFMECTGNEPGFSCDAEGAAVPDSCQDQWTALVACE